MDPSFFSTIGFSSGASFNYITQSNTLAKNRTFHVMTKMQLMHGRMKSKMGGDQSISSLSVDHNQVNASMIRDGIWSENKEPNLEKLINGTPSSMKDVEELQFMNNTSYTVEKDDSQDNNVLEKLKKERYKENMGHDDPSHNELELMNGKLCVISNSDDSNHANNIPPRMSLVEEPQTHNIHHQYSNLSQYTTHMHGLHPLDSTTSKCGTRVGLGIIPFLENKNIFITGATGFLGKVLVEKILRVQPNVKHLYLLIKAKDIRCGKRRLKEEILESNLFKFLQCRHGENYEEFMNQKVSVVVGDISMENLGMDIATFTSLSSKIHIVINSAATTTFDERYDHALNLNTKGPLRIMEFSKRCQDIQLVMHVSTAFVNGKRKGLQQEKLFKYGHSIANEISGFEEQHDNPDIDVDIESKLVEERIRSLKKIKSGIKNFTLSTSDEQKEKLLTLAMKELGMERANHFGWQDTYVFTKAMGEMAIDKMRDHLPTVIIRPSVVESSFREPFPGWMEGNRMMDPILISYGKGQLPGFLVDPKSVLDVVPVDMVVNAMLAAMAEHANKQGLEVYQIASSVVNPLVFSELAKFSEEHFREDPLLDSMGKPTSTFKLQLYQDMDNFLEALSEVDFKFKEKLLSTSCNPKFSKRYEQLALKVKEQAKYLANLYRPYTFYAGRFDASKTQQLYGSLSRQEKQIFNFNVGDIDWETYIKRIHIPGLRKHVLKGRGSNM